MNELETDKSVKLDFCVLYKKKTLIFIVKILMSDI